MEIVSEGKGVNFQGPLLARVTKKKRYKRIQKGSSRSPVGWILRIKLDYLIINTYIFS